MKRILAILLTVLVIFSCFGCGEATEKEQPKNEKEERSYETVMTVFSHKTDTLCPLFSTSESNIQMLQMIFDGLIILTDDLSAEPSLAESWSVSENGKTWTFNLRKGVKWHDDTVFGAKDVVYTVNQIKKNENSAYYYNVSNISDIRAVGESEVKVELNKPWLNFVNLMYFPIVQSRSGDINAENFVPVGTGPYTYTSKKDDPKYFLVRNDKWWGGRPVSECVTVEILADSETALYAFSAGTLDMVTATDANWGKYIDSETSTFTTMESSELCFLGLNNREGALKFPEIRRAVSYAVNRDEMVDSIMMDYAVAARVPAHPNWSLSKNCKFETAQNIESARIELEAYEWVEVGNNWGKSVDDEYYGTAFTILYNEENDTRELVAQMVKENLEAAGMMVMLEKVPYDEYESRILSGEYDMFVGSVIVSPDADFSFFVDEGNIFGFSSEEIKSIKDSMGIDGDSETAELYAPLLKKLDEETPVVSLFFEKKILLHSKRIEGEIKPTSFKIYKGIEYLKKKEAEK